MNPHPRIRWMIRRDMPEVRAIERQCYAPPWSASGELEDWLRRRTSVGMVAETHQEVAGYLLYSLLNRRIDLVNIAVARRHQRQGLGRLMVEKLLGKLSPLRRTKLTTTVSDRDLSAHLFFRALGMRAVGVHRDLFGDGEDAYEFSFDCLERVGAI